MSWWNPWAKKPEPVEEPKALPEPQASVNGFDGSKYPGGLDSLQDLFIDHVLEMDYAALRARSHKLFEENLYGRGLIRRLVTNEVHTGLSLEADPVAVLLGRDEDQLEEWADLVEAKFAAWADSPEVCDYERRVDATFGWLTAEQRREALVGGDVLVVPRFDEDTKTPNVQIISGHLVQNPTNIGSRRIEHGVELDKSGRHVAYHVLDSETGKTTRIPARGPTGRRTAWLVYGTDKRVGQVRGAPLLTIVMQSLREIDRYRDAALRKAVINSILALWIEKGEDKISSRAFSNSSTASGTVADNDGTGPNRSFAVAEQIPGLVWEELQHGEKPHVHKSDSGEATDFPVFEAAIVAAIAWACEMPAEILRLSFDANYSASQASLNEFKMYLSLARQRIARSFTQPIYEQWLVASVNAGSIEAPGLVAASGDRSQFETYRAWVHADWIGSVKPVTDVLKQVRATGELLDRGLMTNAQAARELTGRKWSTIIRKVARERQILADLPGAEEEETATSARASFRVIQEIAENVESMASSTDGGA